MRIRIQVLDPQFEKVDPDQTKIGELKRKEKITKFPFIYYSIILGLNVTLQISLKRHFHSR